MEAKGNYLSMLIFGVFLLSILCTIYPNLYRKLLFKRKTGSADSDVNVLLIYVFAWTNEYALSNMIYFINHAVNETDPVDYYFIVQQVNKRNINKRLLPKLPKNAHYIHHENKCFDYGSMGWFLSKYTTGNPHKNDTIATNEKSKIDVRKYRYFIFMNSSTRGPYFPPYFLTMIQSYEAKSGKKFYWYSVFTERINEKVKLVGPTIVCSHAPHVQGHFTVTDFIGLSLALKSDGRTGPFDCHATFEDAVLYGEIGFSTKVLAEGYMIDCMMRKYQRLNFSASENRNCNGKGDPNQAKGVDNISLDPYELIFVKFNYKLYDWDAANRLKVYDKWTEEVRNNTAKY